MSIRDTVEKWVSPFDTQDMPDIGSDLTDYQKWESKVENKRAVGKAAKVGASWAALAFAAKWLINQGSSGKRDKERANLQSLINAKYPSITPDTDTSDSEEEVERRAVGLGKTAEEESTIISPFTKAMKSIMRTDVAPWQLALTVAAMVGGAKGGWSLASSLGESQEKNDLEQSTTDTRNELDKITAQEYERLHKTGAEKKDVPTSLARLPFALYPVYVAAALAVSYASAKKYSDSKDPNRIAKKELETYLKDKAKLESTPQIINPEKFKFIPKEMGIKGSTNKGKASVDVGDKPAFAENDPYAGII